MMGNAATPVRDALLGRLYAMYVAQCIGNSSAPGCREK